MPLDPQLREMLDQVAAAGRPPMHELPVPEARAAAGFLASLGSYPDPRAVTEDRLVPGPAGDIPVRVYRPDATEELPVLVYFHGGGWVIGGIDSHDSVCQQLATRIPAVVVSVDYRMAPEHGYPAPLEDCYAATRWVAENAGDLGVDGHRLAVAGDSAGANMAALVSLRARDRGAPGIGFQLLVYPATDLTCSFPSHQENGEGYLLDRHSIRWFLDHYIPEPDRKSPEASPWFADSLAGLPPALVITAEFDPLRDEGEAYAARLRQDGVPAKALRYDGMVHGFFGMDGLLPTAGRAMDEAAIALRGALHPGR